VVGRAESSKPVVERGSLPEKNPLTGNSDVAANDWKLSASDIRVCTLVGPHSKTMARLTYRIAEASLPVAADYIGTLGWNATGFVPASASSIVGAG